MSSKPIPKNTKIGFVGLVLIIATATALLPMAKAAAASPAGIQENTDVNIAGKIEGTRFGVIIGKYGSTLQGNRIRYIPKLYLGGLVCGDKIELIDANVIEGEFHIPVIKVRTFEETGTVPANSIGWVKLTDTNFVDSFVADANWLNKPVKRISFEEIKEFEALRRAYEETTQKTDSLRSYKANQTIEEKKDVNIAGTIDGMRFGTIKKKNGSSLQGNKSRYIPKLYLGRLIAGEKIELADANVIEGEYGVPVIKVRTFEQTSTVPANSIGWVALTDTDFVDGFVADAGWLNKPRPRIAEKMKEIEEQEKVYETVRGRPYAEAADANTPIVLNTNPLVFANDVSADLNQITVTFNQPMMDKSWSWTGSGETYPKIRGKPAYDTSGKICSLPVNLEPGKVYWVGINSPSYQNFKSISGTPAKRYVILFATKDKDGKPTSISEDLLQQARAINERSGTPNQ